MLLGGHCPRGLLRLVSILTGNVLKYIFIIELISKFINGKTGFCHKSIKLDQSNKIFHLKIT